MCRVPTLQFIVVLLLEGWVKVAVGLGGEKCLRNILWNQKKIVTLHPLFTHSRVMGNLAL